MWRLASVSGCWSFPNGWKIKVRVVGLAFSSQAGCGGMLFSASREIRALLSGLDEVSDTVINWLTKLRKMGCVERSCLKLGGKVL
ncbi:hypothetical protein GQ457_17G014140 [Hibiscus cannabinus]